MAELQIPEIAEIRAELRAVRVLLEQAIVAPKPEWLSVREAGEILGVSRSTIDRKIRKGELQARGSGRTRMVRVR